MYDELNDEELVIKFREGDEEAFYRLYERYKYKIKNVSARYFLIGGEREDLLQEGLIGLYRAVKGYSAEKNASFATFTHICVENAIKSAVSKARKQGLGEFEIPSFEGPEERVIGTETANEKIVEIKNVLSPFEYSVLEDYYEGMSYAEMAEKNATDVKSVDNALQRIKKKLRGRGAMCAAK